MSSKLVDAVRSMGKWGNMSIRGQGHSLTLAQSHSDFKIRTCFSQKPLSHLKPNFIWKLMGERKWKFILISLVTWPRWPLWPYMLKTLVWNQWASCLETWYVALGTQAHSNLFKWCPWVGLDLFYAQVKFGHLCFCMGKRKMVIHWANSSQIAYGASVGWGNKSLFE